MHKNTSRILFLCVIVSVLLAISVSVVAYKQIAKENDNNTSLIDDASTAFMTDRFVDRIIKDINSSNQIEEIAKAYTLLCYYGCIWGLHDKAEVIPQMYPESTYAKVWIDSLNVGENTMINIHDNQLWPILDFQDLDTNEIENSRIRVVLSEEAKERLPTEVTDALLNYFFSRGQNVVWQITSDNAVLSPFKSAGDVLEYYVLPE